MCIETHLVFGGFVVIVIAASIYLARLFLRGLSGRM